MDDLEAITEALRRQRKDLDTMLDETVSRGDETAKVIEKLDELRRRAEQTADIVPVPDPPGDSRK